MFRYSEDQPLVSVGNIGFEYVHYKLGTLI